MGNLSIDDSDSTFLKGKSIYEEWFSQFKRRWYMVHDLDVLGVMVNTMPVDSRLIDPNSTAMIERMYRNMRGG